jgi:hypothetical protein
MPPYVEPAIQTDIIIVALNQLEVLIVLNATPTPLREDGIFTVLMAPIFRTQVIHMVLILPLLTAPPVIRPILLHH